jgi:cytochrome b561
MIRMSTNTGTKMNTDTATAGSSGSSIGTLFKGSIGIVITTVIGIGMFIGAFVSSSKFVGSKDDWNQVQPQITRVLIYTLIGTFAFMLAALLFFIQDSAKAMYFIMVVCCLSLGLSFASLAIAAISR